MSLVEDLPPRTVGELHEVVVVVVAHPTRRAGGTARRRCRAPARALRRRARRACSRAASWPKRLSARWNMARYAASAPDSGANLLYWPQLGARVVPDVDLDDRYCGLLGLGARGGDVPKYRRAPSFDKTPRPSSQTPPLHPGLPAVAPAKAGSGSCLRRRPSSSTRRAWGEGTVEATPTIGSSSAVADEGGPAADVVDTNPLSFPGPVSSTFCSAPSAQLRASRRRRRRLRRHFVEEA